MNKTLLSGAIASLVAGLWASWQHLQGANTRDEMVTVFGLCSLVWFALATAWAYRRD